MHGRVSPSRFLVAAVAALLGAGVMTAAPASAATGPSLDRLRLLPNAVDTTEGAAGVGVELHGTGTVVELQNASMSATCTTCGGDEPPQLFSAYNPDAVLVRVPGDVTATYTLRAPQTATPGTYRIDSMNLHDSDGGSVHLDDAALTAKGLLPAGRTFTVGHETDSTAPTIDSVVFTPSSVDITTTDATVGLQIATTDSAPGITSMIGNLSLVGDPDTTERAFFSAFSKVGGGAGHATFRDFLFPEYVGTWRLDSVEVTDAYGVERTVDNPGGGSAWPSLSVTQAPDSSAPTLDGPAALAPATVDATSGDAHATLTLDISDDVSGFTYGSVNFTDPETFETLSADVHSDDLTGGTTYAATVFVPQGSTSGDYTATSITLYDRAGNSEERDFDSPLSLGVTTSPDPTDGPELGSLTLALAEVNVSDPDEEERYGTVYVTVTDDVSGLDYGSLGYTDPSGDDDTIYFDESDRVSGDSTNGRYAVRVPLSETGSYPLTGLSLTDNVGHDSTFDAADLGDQAFTVVQEEDSADPSVDSVDVAPTAGVTGETGPTFEVTVHATDVGSGGGAPSGIGWIEVVFASPGGLQQESAYCSGPQCLVNGSDEDGTFRFTLQLADWAQQGTWSLESVQVGDNAGNISDVGGDGIGGVHTLQITGTGDTVAPTVSALTFAPSPVDATAGKPVVVGVVADVSDALSGVQYIEVTLEAPGGAQVVTTSLDRDDGGNGRLLDGMMSGALTLPRRAPSGAWTVRVTIADSAGNSVDLAGAELSALGLPATLQVDGIPDATGPTLMSLDVDHDAVDARTGDKAVVLTARAQDPAGPTWMTLRVVRGTSTVEYVDLHRVGGSVTDGWFQAKLDIDQYAGPGTWSFDDVELTDELGNVTELSTADLTTSGFDHQVVVQSLGDDDGPTLSSVVFSPTTVDVSAGDGSTTATVHVTDALSGLESGTVALEGPEGSYVETSFDATDLTTGNAMNGTYSVPLIVPALSEPGSWDIFVMLTDASGNDSFYDAVDLPAGSTTSVTVVNTTAPVYDGVVQGVVTGPGGPVAGAHVQACNEFWSCSTDTTSGAGAYDISGLRDGDYDVTVHPPTGFNSSSATVLDLYSQPNHTATRNFTLTAPVSLPLGTSVNGQTVGVPFVLYNQPFPMATEGCPGGVATYTVTQGGTTLRTGTLTEGPAGHYATTVAPLNSPGTSTVAIAIDCPGSTPDSSLSFSLYIDPSGFVYDHDGTTTVPGAQVTLYRAETEDGSYTQVPNGSLIMDPSNRSNPDVTDSTGHYGWLTVAGWYRVDVTKANCYRPGSYNPTTNSVDKVTPSRLVQVPPEVTDLHVTIDCRNIPPKALPTRSAGGSVTTGSTVSFAANASDANGSVASYSWNFGDGTTGTGAAPSHTYASAGTFTPKVTVTDNQGLASTQVSLAAITVAAPVITPPASPARDTTAPSVAMAGLGTTTLGATAAVGWSGSDNIAVATYDLRYRSAAWNKTLGGYIYPAALQGTPARSASQPIASGVLYCFSTRARDAAGNLSGWTAERCTAKPLDDRALLAKGAWAKTKGKAYFTGTIATSKAKNATLTRAGALPGRVALVASKGKGFGKVGVYYNGKLVTTVNLKASKATNKTVIALPKLTKKGTITLKVLTAGKTVQIDGLLTSRL